MSDPLTPKWFWWTHWGLAIGSSQRYKPSWWERRAYIEGLTDAARIVESRRFAAHYGNVPQDDNELRARRSMGRESIIEIHKYVTNFLGLPNDGKQFGLDDDDSAVTQGTETLRPRAQGNE
jgi:hypothetical protein